MARSAWEECRSLEEMQAQVAERQARLKHLLAEWNQTIEDNAPKLVEFHNLVTDLCEKYPLPADSAHDRQ